jgi:predicted AlkP superfamily pyrophosphatase or phosphodiesterase
MKAILYVLDGCQVDALRQVDTPEARELRRRALIYEGAETIYPSLTGPGHASIITGVKPGAHGLVSHMYWDWGGAAAKNIYSDAAFQRPTVFKLLSESGVMSQGHGNYFRGGLNDPPTKRALKWLAGRLEASAAVSSLVDSMPRVEKLLKRSVAGSLEGLEQRITESRDQVHYVVDNRVDKASHKYGPDSTEYAATLEDSCSNIMSLLNALESARQDHLLIVTSDHGHMAIKHKVDADSLDLNEVGLPIRDTMVLNANLVVTYGTVGVEAVAVVVSRHIQVYVKDKTKIGRIAQALSKKPYIHKLLVGSGIHEWGVANQRTGDIIGGFRDNVGFAELPIGERGDHGGFSRQEMEVPLWFIGPNIGPGVKRGAHTVDIAPTLCGLLGVSTDGTRFDGEVLTIQC